MNYKDEQADINEKNARVGFCWKWANRNRYQLIGLIDEGIAGVLQGGEKN